MNKAIEPIIYCLKLSWESSILYTVVRLIGRMTFPVTSIVQAYIMKQIIDAVARIGDRARNVTEIIPLSPFLPRSLFFRD